jgi:hypothetical protein
MKRWFAVWAVLAFVVMARSEWHNPLYRDLDLNWMGAAYVTLHHLIAVGTADFFASWFMLLVPPLLLWYAGTAIVLVVKRAAIKLGP